MLTSFLSLSLSLSLLFMFYGSLFSKFPSSTGRCFFALKGGSIVCDVKLSPSQDRFPLLTLLPPPCFRHSISDCVEGVEARGQVRRENTGNREWKRANFDFRRGRPSVFISILTQMRLFYVQERERELE